MQSPRACLVLLGLALALAQVPVLQQAPVLLGLRAQTWER